MEGIFSHYATADEADLTYTAAQNQIFCDVVTSLKKRNINPPLIHIGNSAGILTYPCDITTAVRPGIILYGINPSEYVEETKQPPLKPVMNFYSKIANIAELREGETVSYGRKFHANAPRKLPWSAQDMPMDIFADSRARQKSWYADNALRSSEISVWICL